MIIRQATQADAHLLAELSTHVQQVHVEARPRTFRPAEVSEDLITFYADLLPQLDNYFFIAEEGGTAVGYVFVKHINRPINPYTHADTFLHIDQISVNPDARGKGCGKALMQAVYDLAARHSIQRITLDVWQFNETAIEFYRNLGFNPFMQRMEIFLDESN
ncbi:MAG: GNAT family N-acetyltransferase [Anaerolineae bacterium]|nr:GNAT family N-acetyltransferase [Anaerolineae bacterium]